MLFLDSTRSLEAQPAAAPGTPLDFASAWADLAGAALTPGVGDGRLGAVLGNPPVVVVPAPASGTFRQLKWLTVFNNDAAAAQVAVRLTNGAAARVLVSWLLQPGETLGYTDHHGWQAWTALGELKVTVAAGGGGSGGGGSTEAGLAWDLYWG